MSEYSSDYFHIVVKNKNTYSCRSQKLHYRQLIIQFTSTFYLFFGSIVQGVQIKEVLSVLFGQREMCFCVVATFALAKKSVQRR